MSFYLTTGVLALVALLASVAGFGWRYMEFRRLPRPRDRSVMRENPRRGILYAFTIGMAPWSKESTRIHWLSYLRGIGFHIGIFAGLAALVASPWLSLIPWRLRILFAFVTALGALFGAQGAAVRLADENFRAISTRDDHVSVWLVSLFLAGASLALWSLDLLPLMWLTAAAMLVYAPLSKIRHCLFFYFGRLFYGLHIGRRGIVRGLEASHGK